MQLEYFAYFNMIELEKTEKKKELDCFATLAMTGCHSSKTETQSVSEGHLQPSLTLRVFVGLTARSSLRGAKRQSSFSLDGHAQ